MKRFMIAMAVVSVVAWLRIYFITFAAKFAERLIEIFNREEEVI